MVGHRHGVCPFGNRRPVPANSSGDFIYCHRSTLLGQGLSHRALTENGVQKTLSENWREADLSGKQGQGMAGETPRQEGIKKVKHLWQIQEPEEAATEALCQKLGITKLLAQCLVNRGLAEPDAASQFLTPKLANLGAPEAIPNLEAAVSRLLIARKQEERVVVFGDYDVDGVTSTTLLLDSLGTLG